MTVAAGDTLPRVDRYEVVREIGRGGMAVVYLARQTDLERDVALKELRLFDGSDPSAARRFVRESRVGAALSHPNVVTVHDYFEQDGAPYIAMEYLARGSLRPYVGHTSTAQNIGVLEGLLAGLDHAARARGRAPRHQAREPHGHGRGARQDRRLRDREGDVPRTTRARS